MNTLVINGNGVLRVVHPHPLFFMPSTDKKEKAMSPKEKVIDFLHDHEKPGTVSSVALDKNGAPYYGKQFDHFVPVPGKNPATEGTPIEKATAKKQHRKAVMLMKKEAKPPCGIVVRSFRSLKAKMII